MKDNIDLGIAKSRLQSKELTLVIVKNKELIFETKKTGLIGFIEAIEMNGILLKNSSVADKVVGKAIAFLCVYSKVVSVYAEVVSVEAKKLLEKNKIMLKWSMIVKEILDTKKNTTCPFEMKAKNMDDPTQFYFEVKNSINIKNCRENLN